MLKYANYDIVFQEIPDEVTLAINISNCPNRCEGCHSPYLWKDVGKCLDVDELEALVKSYKSSITCVCFMGGDAAPDEVSRLATQIKQRYNDLRVGWYSGRNELPQNVASTPFDYIKIGRYDARYGPLDSPTTNQRMMKKLADGRVKDITEHFRKNKPNSAVNMPRKTM